MSEISTRPQAGRPLARDLTAAALLALCLCLAASLVWSRALAPAVRVEGWAITFRPPGGWKALTSGNSSRTTTVVYQEPGSRGKSRQLVVSRHLNPDRLPPDRICEILLAERLGPILGLFARQRIPIEHLPLGHLPGARSVIGRPQGACLHVGTVTRDDGTAEAYLLELRSNRPFARTDLSLCDALAEAVRPAG